MSRLWVLTAVVLVTAVGSGAGAASRRPVRTAIVTIDKLAFGPAPTSLRVGDVVEWVNHDIFRHSATAAGRFDIDLAPGGKGGAVMKQAGVVIYVCRYHPGMKSRIKVDP